MDTIKENYCPFLRNMMSFFKRSAASLAALTVAGAGFLAVPSVAYAGPNSGGQNAGYTCSTQPAPIQGAEFNFKDGGKFALSSYLQNGEGKDLNPFTSTSKKDTVNYVFELKNNETTDQKFPNLWLKFPGDGSTNQDILVDEDALLAIPNNGPISNGSQYGGRVQYNYYNGKEPVQKQFNVSKYEKRDGLYFTGMILFNKTLKPGESIRFTLPLKFAENAPASAYSVWGEQLWGPTIPVATQLYTPNPDEPLRSLNQIIAAETPYKYLATEKFGSDYIAAPLEVQELMPQVSRDDFTIFANNIAKACGEEDPGNAPHLPWDNYYISVNKVKDNIRDIGYSVLPVQVWKEQDGTRKDDLVDFYRYTNIGAEVIHDSVTVHDDETAGTGGSAGTGGGASEEEAQKFSSKEFYIHVVKVVETNDIEFYQYDDKYYTDAKITKAIYNTRKMNQDGDAHENITAQLLNADGSVVGDGKKNLRTTAHGTPLDINTPGDYQKWVEYSALGFDSGNEYALEARRLANIKVKPIHTGSISVIEGESYDTTTQVTNEDGSALPDNIKLEDVTPKDEIPARYGKYTAKVKISFPSGATKVVDVPVTITPKLAVINQAPVVGVQDKTIFVGDDFKPEDLLVSATDAEDGDVASKVVISGDYDASKAGTYELTFTVTDSQGATTTKKATLKVVEKAAVINHAPVVVTTDKTITVGDAFTPTDLLVSATDHEDGDVVENVTISGDYDASKPGTYELTYTVTDSAGAKTVKTATLTVLENAAVINHAPVVVVQDKTIIAGEAFAPADLLVSATDAEDGDVVANVAISGDYDASKPGKYELTYTVTDSQGAKATKKATLTVLQKAAVINQAPVLVVQDKTITAGDAFKPEDLLVSATDAEDGDLAAKVTISGDYDATKPGTYELTFTVVDSQGATTTHTAKLTVLEKKVEEPTPTPTPETPQPEQPADKPEQKPGDKPEQQPADQTGDKAQDKSQPRKETTDKPKQQKRKLVATGADIVLPTVAVLGLTGAGVALVAYRRAKKA